MVNVQCPVKKGFIVNQEGQFEIQGIVVRGRTSVAVKGLSQEDEKELSGGMEVDLPSFIELCKHILIETGTLPKWFFIGVVVDANNSQLLTYFSPNKDKFFSEIYNYIKENLALNLPMADTERVVKNFFEGNPDYHFNYIMVPLESVISGSTGGKVEPFDIRI